MRLRSILSVFVVALTLPAAASASTTIGTIVEPSGSSVFDCSGIAALFGQFGNADEVTTGGLISSWSVNATGDGKGTETLYVLAPSGSNYTVVGTDTEALPSTIPANGTVTFTPAAPIAAAIGDSIAVSAIGTGVGGTGPVNCAWNSTDDEIPEAWYASDADAGVGQPVVPTPFGAPGTVIDVEATISPGPEDSAVSTSAGPTNAVVGNEALLSSTVTNNGPYPGPATFTDTVPAGLAIDAVAATDGTCSIAAQVVTCSIANVAVGANAAVEVVVTPFAAMSYQNAVSVADASGTTDPNTANNAASATLTVGTATGTGPGTGAGTAATRACVATNSLKGLSEKLVKRLLPALGCKVGKIKKATSKKVAKGDVISLKPGSGSHPAGTKVTLTISSGKPKPKHKKHKG
jgi:hypothetical protein